MYIKTKESDLDSDLKTGESRFWAQVGIIQKEGSIEYKVAPFKCYPDIASYLLSLNTFDRQRNLSSRNVDKFAQALRNDSFSPGSAIRLTWHMGRWVLTDGQHRLFAIVESGIAADMTVLFVFRDIHVEYATVDSIGGLRSPREVALAYGFKYTEEITARNLDRFLSASGIIYANFLQNNSVVKDKLEVSRFAESENFPDSMRMLREWAEGSAIFGSGGGSIKASVLAVALVTTKYAPLAISSDFWRNVFQNDGLKRRDVRRLLNEVITLPSRRGGESSQYEIVKIASNLWNAHVEGRGELDKVYTPKTMPNIKLTPYPLKTAEQKSL